MQISSNIYIERERERERETTDEIFTKYFGQKLMHIKLVATDYYI